jgi:protease I
MALPLAQKKIAILISNGFDEHPMTEIQRALTKAGGQTKVVAPETGVVHGWHGEAWGHHYNVDAPLGEALGSDFDMLVLPSGARGTAKLKLNPHTRRIVNHFLDAGKPVSAIGEGVGLLALGTNMENRTVASVLEIRDELATVKVQASEYDQEIDQNLLTSNGNDLEEWVESSVAFFTEMGSVKHAA